LDIEAEGGYIMLSEDRFDELYDTDEDEVGYSGSSLVEVAKEP
jgi:hypothetical protein